MEIVFGWRSGRQWLHNNCSQIQGFTRERIYMPPAAWKVDPHAGLRTTSSHSQLSTARSPWQSPFMTDDQSLVKLRRRSPRRLCGRTCFFVSYCAWLVWLAGASACEEGWRQLFNKRNLDGWVALGNAKWGVEDGVIVGGQDGDPKRSGLLATTDKFKDFELKLEFMIDEHGKYNSGVYLRNDPGTAGRTGYQVNIGRGAAEEYSGGIYTDRWLAKGDEFDTIRRKLEWNHLHIIARGGHLQIWLNGVKVADYHDLEPSPELLQPGVIGFQTYGAEGHSGWVKFRKICIRELSE